MAFYELEFPLQALDSEAVEEALSELGALSVTLIDGGDEPVLEPKPGEIRLWSDTRLKALFDESSDPTLVLARLGERLGAATATAARLTRVADRAWERVWLQDWHAMRFGGRLWVCPTTDEPPADPAAVVVRLDPGLAFGTGSHPTTALCLQVLESLPVAGRSVLDYGCGSGILGIAALKLGAARVVAVDLDPQALIATRDNARRNGVEAGIVVQDVEAPVPVSQLVLANILAGPLVELAPRLTAACAPGGQLVLSGLLRTQAYEVKAAYASGFDMVRIIEREEWCCLSARRAP